MPELISTKNLEAYVVRSDHLEALEDSLGWYGDQYIKLERDKQLLNLNQRVPKERLTGLLGEVERATTDILGITDPGKILLNYYEWKPYLQFSAKRAALVSGVMSIASIFDGVGIQNILLYGAGGYSALTGLLFLETQRQFGISHYDFSRRTVFISQSDNTEAKAASIMSASIAQHILHEKTDLYDGENKDRYIGHGFTVGMEHLVGQRLSEQHNNPVYRYQPLKDLTGELKEAYLTVCAHNGLEPKSYLANSDIPSLRGGIDRIRLFRERFTYPWALATAVMAIAESRFGEGVYRALLNEDLSFLRQ